MRVLPILYFSKIYVAFKKRQTASRIHFASLSLRVPQVPLWAAWMFYELGLKWLEVKMFFQFTSIEGVQMTLRCQPKFMSNLSEFELI